MSGKSGQVGLSGQKYKRKSVKKVRPFQRNEVDNRKPPQEVSFVSTDPLYEDDDDENDDDDGSRAASDVHITFKQLQAKAQELLKTRKSLPVYQNRDEIMQCIAQNQVTVLIGETGSGKSTQIPQFLLADVAKRSQKNTNARTKGVAITQPRRVAAINLATRVAQEHGCMVGGEVGYSVRFDNCTSKKTKLKYLTDGMLLRELMMHKTLKDYSTIIIDEAHERTILTDLILGFLKSLLKGARPDLRIIIMSATLQAEKFSSFFHDAPILFVEGRKFPVAQYYLPAPCDDVVDSIIRCCVQINLGEQLGDILCFLPGQEEIDKAVTILNKISKYISDQCKVPLMVGLPLYAALPPAQQAKVFSKLKGFKRKVVFSTNVAETSVTISGVKFVIDSGLRKVKVWRHQLGLATLLTVPISRASAMQRTGRAGRESEGKSYRLYCEKDFSQLPMQTEPEIARSDITSPLLMLKRYDVDDVVNWTWFEHPGKDAMILGLQELYQLGALNDYGKITKRGEQMALLPLAPQLSSVLIHASEAGCLSTVIDIASCLSVENLLLNPPPEQRDEVNEKRVSLCNEGNRYGDLIMLKELYDIFTGELQSAAEKQEWCRELCISYRGFKNVLKIRGQLMTYCERLFSGEARTTAQDQPEADHSSTVLRCFLTGFARNCAIGMPDRSYRTVVTGEPISVHPSSMLFLNKQCPAIMYTEYVFTTKGYARNVSRIQLDWLQAGKAVAKERAHND
ncbi:hypothetical protein HG535_0C00960 [Zygotorulaspora mrakii]|uniref:RNA helicase n=1 Tax=Zygotorulaspora mrakii TaxID=42260 RepID=A0A7H9AZW0_ZYGMR|nr:uncharacterized protein HG535_0C00960 [Zygotorulaspora mrakii]QLG71747.1 hypothetical protein HG535_0C00960 [Zygotorulaspora mrakii]